MAVVVSGPCWLSLMVRRCELGNGATHILDRHRSKLVPERRTALLGRCESVSMAQLLSLMPRKLVCAEAEATDAESNASHRRRPGLLPCRQTRRPNHPRREVELERIEWHSDSLIDLERHRKSDFLSNNRSDTVTHGDP